jgi:hypothetical protein
LHAAGHISGYIRLNGHPCHTATYARLSGYVEQSDIHSERATVHEALMFSAALRMPSSVPRKVRLAFVGEVRSDSSPQSIGSQRQCIAMHGFQALISEGSLRPSLLG